MGRFNRVGALAVALAAAGCGHTAAPAHSAPPAAAVAQGPLVQSAQAAELERLRRQLTQARRERDAALARLREALASQKSLQLELARRAPVAPAPPAPAAAPAASHHAAPAAPEVFTTLSTTGTGSP